MRYLLLIGMMSCLQFVFAQEPNVRGTFGHILLGPNFLNMSDLNETLAEFDYPDLGSSYFALGAGIHRVRHRWVFGGDVYGYMINQAVGAGNESILQYVYGTGELGFTVWRKKNQTILYPAAGIGGGLAIFKTKPDGVFTTIIEKTGGAIGDFSLNLRYFFPIQGDDDNKVLFGLRVGYITSIGHDSWTVPVIEPDKSARIPLSGVYVRLSLGMGNLLE